MRTPFIFKDPSVFVVAGISGINLGLATAFVQVGADTALFLASSHAAFVTGFNMVVHGGSFLAGGRDDTGALI